MAPRHELVFASLESQLPKAAATHAAIIPVNRVKHVCDPVAALNSRKYRRDVAGTLVHWVDQAQEAGALQKAANRPDWMDKKIAKGEGAWASVCAFREELVDDDGAQELQEAYDYLRACYEAGSDTSKRWDMSFKGEVDIDWFLIHADHHGVDHLLAKLELALNIQDNGGKFYEDLVAA